jgi:PAS domain S-box-containing protein
VTKTQRFKSATPDQELRKPCRALKAFVIERRILILAPLENDARLTAEFLAQADLFPQICRKVSDLCAAASEGCGAILLAEETLNNDSISPLVDTLEQQPPWSDIPVTIITSGGEANQVRLRQLALFGPGGSVTVLERPFRPGTLVSTLEVALRSRQRQYESRDLVLAMEELVRQHEAKTRLFDATLSSINDLAYTFDLEGNWIYANHRLLKLWGKSLQEILGKSSLELGYPPELAKRLKRQVKEVISSRQPLKGETWFTDAAGIEDYHEYIFSPVFAEDGQVSAVCGTTRLTTERKRAEAAAEGHRRVLQLIAEDKPLRDILDALMRMVELESPRKTYASVLLLDVDGVHLRDGAAPSLPAGYRKAIDGITIGPAIGSCGTAAFSKKPIYVSDITTDPRWVNYKDAALEHGLRACWSIPILSTRGALLGTLAIYHPEPSAANERDLRIAEIAVRTAAIAIERKLSDAALRETQQRYSQLVHGLPTAIYTTDADGYITLYNEAAEILWGRKPELGKDLWCGSHRIFSPEGNALPLSESPMAVTLREGRPVREQEIIIERPNGTRRNVLPYPDPIFDASGKVVGAVNMLMDITESKKAEDASRRLAAIVESSEDAIISKDLNGVITSWNVGAQRLFGYEAEEIIGKPVTILMPPDRESEASDILQNIRRGQGKYNFQTVRQRKDGTIVDISLTVSPIRGADGKIIGASKIVRDITEQKQAERKLELAHQETVAASKAKDEFLAALSHELRTPLNPVLLLASEAADNPQLPSQVRSHFTTIRNNVELEARLIDDLLDITRISHGKISLNLEPVDVHGILEQAITTVRSDLEEKHIKLDVNFSAKYATVKGDAVRLQQVFWNVLKNAVKFTPAAGRISLSTAIQSPDLVITVTDNGIGMTESELDRIFEAFAQGEHGAGGGSHRFGGLGLGLAISQNLVKLHAGCIQATSRGQNCGSTFTVMLPLVKPLGQGDYPTKQNGHPETGKASPTLPCLKILLVEDHEPTRAALVRLLIRRGHDVRASSCVAEALILGDRFEFQLLISDIGLPDGNGFDLMKSLQQKHQNIQGIALTGYGMEQDVKKTREAGFEIHLTKPIRVESLEAALSAVVSSGHGNTVKH